MKYKPNFLDPRVQLRTQRAIDFVKRYLKDKNTQWLSTRWIHHTDHLGSQRHPLGKYLREVLLICVDERYSKEQGQCKKYRLNQEGLNFLETKVHSNNTQTTYSVLQVATKFEQELNNGPILYNDTSDRLYHWLQNQRRSVKAEVFVQTGLIHTYDIVCAAPTLLHQKSQQVPLVIENKKWIQGPMDLYLPHLRDYLVNRRAIRQQLAEQSEIDIKTIKRLINGLFQGAQISKYNKTRCYQELDGDLARIEFLNQNEFIQGLKEDIRIMWEYLRPIMPLRTQCDKLGRTRRLPISGKQKTGLYRQLERQVLEVIKEYLTVSGVKFYTEHDGWSCDREINRDFLRDFVRARTGFQLEFDYELLNNKAQTTYSVVDLFEENI